MTVKIYVPRDSAALAVGADRVAKRIAEEAAARGLDIELVRNGSRGALLATLTVVGLVGVVIGRRTPPRAGPHP